MTDPDRLTCAGCGLLCDDVTVVPGDALRLEPPCGLGAEWFRRAHSTGVHAAATVGGQPADVDTALARAAELLLSARRPLLHGFEAATVEDARAAVALADRLGALVVTGDVSGPWPGAPAVPLRGASTATLGEIRDRSQLVVIWREDPEQHPSPAARSALASAAIRPRGPRAGRTLLVVDDRDTATAERADAQLRWPADRDLEALSALHVLQRNLPLLDRELAPRAGGRARAPRRRAPCRVRVRRRTERRSRRPAARARPARAGAGAVARPPRGHARAAERRRHAERGEVLAWQTGYAPDVDLAAGHPELVTAPGPLAAAEGVDVSLCIEGAPGELPAGVTRIALGSLPVDDAEVSIRTAPAGVAAAGTLHRLDGVPLALQAPLPAEAPTAAELLGRLLAEVTR